MPKLDDRHAIDINNLIHYVMWSKDKIAGGVKQEEAVQALSRVIDYPVVLMNNIAGKDKELDTE
jgi:hypothetical protein